MKVTPVASNMTELEGGDGTRVLFSYQTPVAAFLPGTGFLKSEELFSVTTTKHIGKWLQLNDAVPEKVTKVPHMVIEGLVETIGKN